MRAYIDMFKNYANFKGRTNRSDFWTALVINMIVPLICIIIGKVFNGLPSIIANAISGIYLVSVMIPHFALMVRRIRDTGKSGAYFFCFFIPLVGPFIILWQFLQPSAEVE